MGGTPYLVLQNLIKSQQLEKSGCVVGKLAVASLNGQVSPPDFLWNYYVYVLRLLLTSEKLPFQQVMLTTGTGRPRGGRGLLNTQP